MKPMLKPFMEIRNLNSPKNGSHGTSVLALALSNVFSGILLNYITAHKIM